MTETRIAQLEAEIATLQRLLEVNKTLNSALLSSTLRVEALLSYIMEAAAEITDSEAASVLLWNHNLQELFFAATTSTNANARSLIGKPIPLDSIAGRILRENRMIQVDEVQKDPRHYSKVDQELQFVTRSLLGVPMVSKERVIGVLEVVNKNHLPWTEQDHQYLLVLAEEAAVAIEVAQLVVAVQKAYREVSELDKLKSDFIAIASHELRTPLGVILGYASFLQEGAADEENRDHATKVMQSALQLRQIVENMVNLRYLKQNSVELQREEVTASELLEDLRREMILLAEAKQHRLMIEFPEEDVTVNIDRTRIMMALTNTMNNAVRFTLPGGIIRVETRVHNGQEVWISITDTGIGIDKKELQRIFDEFYQVEDHMTRRHGGLGIGLSIARASVQAHQGRMWAESQGIGKGATFVMTLPLA